MAQTLTVHDNLIRVRYGAVDEVHEFATVGEAEGRARIVAEATSWIGTPFRNCADVKGKNGGIDCAMLLVRSYVDSGRLPPFDPRPYPPDWYLHREEERFLEWIEVKLGAKRTTKLAPGNVVVWQFGRCFSHGGLLINSTEVVHAYGVAGMCLRSRLVDNELDEVSINGFVAKRPRLVFDPYGEV